MMKRFCTFFLICLTLSCWLPIVDAQTVRMPDASLAAVVRDALGIASNEPITREAMQDLTSLDAELYKIREVTGHEIRIRSLTGLEHATRLKSLRLFGNFVSDFRPLVGLRHLEDLGVEYNQISDIRPLTILVQLQGLFLDGNSIDDLSPLRKLTRLRRLGVSVRFIGDLHPYVDLTQLETLHLEGWFDGRSNYIRDIELLSTLTQLRLLYIRSAHVSDISFVRGMTQLEELYLWHNQFSDLKPLAGLTRLKVLGLSNNNIHHVEPLAELIQLTWLALDRNQILDVSPLAGLINLETLYLKDNPIEDTSPLAHLPNLRPDRVDFYIPPGISISNEIPDELPRVGKPLKYTILIRNAENVTGFSLTYDTPRKLTSTEAVEWFPPIVHKSKTRTLAASRLEIGRSIRKVAIFNLNATAAGEGELRIQGTLAARQGSFKVDVRYPITIFPSDETQPISRDAEVDSTPAGVAIPDRNLAAAVRKRLGLGANARITQQALEQLTELDAGNSNIKNLAGLEHATQLTRLSLNKNQIRNLNPLLGLTQLKDLRLDENKISNLRPLKGLTQLETLHIGRNQINNSGVQLLTNLTRVKSLSLHGNKIGNIKPLAKLTKLEGLWLNENKIRDVSPLAGLVNLEVLHLQDNLIRNIRPLVNLTKLTDLRLGENPIADKSPLRSLTDQNPQLKLDIEIPRPSPVVHVGAAQRPPMYWVDTEAGTLHRLTGATVEHLMPNLKQVTSPAVDVASGKLYWTMKRNSQENDRRGRIRRSNLNGTNALIVKNLTHVPHGIALDVESDKIYLTNPSGTIQRLNFNGSNFQSNFITGLNSPKDLAVDGERDQLYWAEPDSIWRADLNGNNTEVFAPNLGEVGSITIAGSKIYSIERPGGEQRWQIRSSTFDGLTPPQTLVTLQSRPIGLAVDTAGSKLYWTTANGKIQRANLNGRNIKDIVTGLRAPGDIVLGVPTRTNPAAPENTSLVTRPLPDETLLLANYPNPFNPETWIPYQLATDTDVQLLIYDAHGGIVRRLVLGHQRAGIYRDRSRAAYWDGRNTLGERVASGLYFYQLQTDNVSSLRKMLILK